MKIAGIRVQNTYIYLALITLLFFQSCATLLLGTYQKVNFVDRNGDSINDLNLNEFSTSEDSTSSPYTQNGRNSKFSKAKTTGHGEDQFVKVRKGNSTYIVHSRDGYKDQVYGLYREKNSPAIFLNIFWFPGFIVDIFTHANNMFQKDIEYHPLLKKVEWDESKKFIFVKQGSFGTDSLKIKVFKHYQKFKDDIPSKVYYHTVDAELHTNYVSFQSSLNSLLNEYGFSDSSNINLSNSDLLYLTSEIDEIGINLIHRQSYEVFMGGLYELNCSVKWILSDAYGHPIFETKTHQVSSQCIDYDKEKFHYLFNDMIEKSLINFISLDTVNHLIKKENAPKYDTLHFNLKRNFTPCKTNECKEKVVVIKTEQGHGSGAIIASNGYILTNYHVVSKSDTVEVIMNSGLKIKGAVIGFDYAYDLAIIHIDTNGLNHFNLESEEIYEGMDIMVIGTPLSIEFRNSISKGIISGYRSFNDLEYIQTDANINPGNSGGPLISPNGELYGIINAKVIGSLVEGIGFAIPVNSILEKSILKFTYE